MYITLRQYAEREQISVPSARKRVERGKVKCKRDKGLIYVEVEGQSAPVPAEEPRSALEDRWSVENELKLAKVRNLEAEITLKKQKVTSYRERLRTEFCEGVLEAYTDAFSDLKGIVVDLKLKKDQIRRFKETYSKCLKKFEQKLRAYLKQKDKEEEEESRDDTTKGGMQ